MEERTATRLELGERAVGRCPAARMKLLRAARDAMVGRGGDQTRWRRNGGLGGDREAGGRWRGVWGMQGEVRLAMGRRSGRSGSH